MTELCALWLPILLGAVFCFVVSSAIHMGPFWHKNDFPKVPDAGRYPRTAAMHPSGDLRGTSCFLIRRTSS